jgi:hemerythrin
MSQKLSLLQSANSVSRALTADNADKVTVKEVCESFLEHCAGRNERDERMTRKMLTVYRGHVNNHILHEDHGLGSVRLSQLTARSVENLETDFAATA